MESIKLLATLLPLSLTAGINLYATVAIVGISAKFHLIEGMPKGLNVFDNWGIIVIASLLYLVEFVVDKFEFFDNAWDVISTAIRPLGAIIIGLSALGSVNPALSIVGALVCGGVALQSHISKAGTRAAINVLSPGETFSNAGISLAEDGFVVVMVILALNYPGIASILTSIIIVFLAIVVPRLFRWTFFFIKSVFAWVGSWFDLKPDYDQVPASLMSAVGHTETIASLECKCTGVKGIKGKNGYLLIMADKIAFVFRKWFKANKWEQDLEKIPKAYLRKKLFIDIIEIPYKNKKGKDKTAHFAFLKTRRDLVEKAVILINKM